MYSFEKLDVWKDARNLVKIVYQITDTFPKREQFGLISQIRRAAISVGLNIVEGSGRVSARDQANFYKTAYSSALEILGCFIISADLQLVSEQQISKTIRPEIEKITNKLNALRKAVLNRNNISIPTTQHLNT